MNKLFVVIMAALLTACGPNLKNIGKESDPTRFYTLAPMAEKPENLPDIANVQLMVRDVVVAEYLDRSHIVVRESATELKLSEFDRWAATPEEDIQRVLAANLNILLGSERVMTEAQKRIGDNDYVLDVFVERFERNEEGNAQLTASWQLLDTAKRRVVASRRETLTRPTGGNYDAITRELSELVSELSTHVAASLRQYR